MSEITTMAGLSMLDTYFDLQRDSGPEVYAAIAAIEAEAREQGLVDATRGLSLTIVAAERARIRAAVEGLEGWAGFEVAGDGTVGKTAPRHFVTRAAVLAIIDDAAPAAEAPRPTCRASARRTR